MDPNYAARSLAWQRVAYTNHARSGWGNLQQRFILYPVSSYALLACVTVVPIILHKKGCILLFKHAIGCKVRLQTVSRPAVWRWKASEVPTNWHVVGRQQSLEGLIWDQGLRRPALKPNI